MRRNRRGEGRSTLGSGSMTWAVASTLRCSHQFEWTVGDAAGECSRHDAVARSPRTVFSRLPIDAAMAQPLRAPPRRDHANSAPTGSTPTPSWCIFPAHSRAVAVGATASIFVDITSFTSIACSPFSPSTSHPYRSDDQPRCTNLSDLQIWVLIQIRTRPGARRSRSEGSKFCETDRANVFRTRGCSAPVARRVRREGSQHSALTISCLYWAPDKSKTDKHKAIPLGPHNRTRLDGSPH